MGQWRAGTRHAHMVALAALAAIVGLLAVLPAHADAQPQSRKKAIWGPVEVDGRSQFPIYRELGVGILQLTLDWRATAPERPARPTSPDDPAYRWPAEIESAARQAGAYGIALTLRVTASPAWANGGRDSRWAPDRSSDFADFIEAAARRFPSVRHWMIWEEPSKASNFQPLKADFGRPLRGAGLRGPQRYAQILDAAFGRLKRLDRRNLVIGGNTYTVGTVGPLNFMRALRLPNGRRPRMDLYGHNPFSLRRPKISLPQIAPGYAEFADLDTLAGWVDRYLGRRNGRPIKLFLSEYALPTDRANFEFNFHVTRKVQARWLAEAFRETRRWSRIYTLGYLGLYDQARRPKGDEVRWGLIDNQGRRKPAFDAYRRG